MGNLEQTLLGSDAAAASCNERLTAWQGLRLSMDQALAILDAASVRLDPLFVDFIEQCCVKGIRVCILSRGMKAIIRALLRDEGIGHIEVLAHDMYVDPDSKAWCVSLRDSSVFGHDKAESMRRALSGRPCTPVVLVGRHECDYTPVVAGRVDCVVAPQRSALADLCDRDGVRYHAFSGWDELASHLL